jgi:hypothetical protein
VRALASTANSSRPKTVMRDSQGRTAVEDQVGHHVKGGQGGVSDLGNGGTGRGQTNVCVENVGQVDKDEQDDPKEHRTLGQPYRNSPTPQRQDACQVEEYEKQKDNVGDDTVGPHGEPDQEHGR